MDNFESVNINPEVSFIGIRIRQTSNIILKKRMIFWKYQGASSYYMEYEWDGGVHKLYITKYLLIYEP